MQSAGSTIYDILSADHAMVASAMDAIEHISDPTQRKNVFSFIRTELVMHSAAEEEAFYRPLRKAVRNQREKEMIEHAFDDHHDIESLLLELQTSSAAKSSWMDKIRELQSIFRHHVREEESHIFRIAQDIFSTKEAKDIAIHMLEEKGRLGMENPFAVAMHKVRELTLDD